MGAESQKEKCCITKQASSKSVDLKVGGWTPGWHRAIAWGTHSIASYCVHTQTQLAETLSCCRR